jgi:FkbH-like protein
VGVPELYWLPEQRDWSERMREAERDQATSWADLVALANARLDFLRTERLDRALCRLHGDVPPPGLSTRPVRLAVLGSSTLVHLHAGIRVAALRRGMWVSTYENEYGQYFQELVDPASPLHRFRPDAVLFAFDARHLTAGLDVAADTGASEAALERILAKIVNCWRLAHRGFNCPVLQQTVVPALIPLLGSNEHRLPGSPVRLIARLNEALRERAETAGVHLVALDARAAQDGVCAWHDPMLWLRAKQDITPAAAPFYGDMVVRVLAALQGRSYKCLVLDLDNTLWGGVLGDDGVSGLELGNGSTAGEAFLAVQEYVAQLARRGVILAVCSKNEEANALAAFADHPEMVLRRSDFACFKANWDDKAANLRAIARELNIGADALVFVDDSPFERNLVRRELPELAVPEIPEDEPGLIPLTLADAGYFEGLSVTADDRARAAHYQANQARRQLQSQATDLISYLRELKMQLVWRRFDRAGLGRIVQLVNKTNQFNLTTRRYTEEEVLMVMADPCALGLQLRLLDRFGDNGVIAIVIGRFENGDDCCIDTWLMSCRVLGRQVEEATLGVLAEQARSRGARRLIGEYRPTARNSMVAEHYSKLGFTIIERETGGGHRAVLELARFAPREIVVEVKEAT